MTATTIAQVMTGIATRLATIDGLRTTADGTAPDQINPPQAIVGVPPIPQYHQSMAMGRFRLEVPVYLLVSAALDRTGQLQLAGFADPAGATSVRAVIEADRTLGRVVDDCVVQDFRPLGAEEVGAIGYYGGVFTLLIYAQGA